MDTAVHIAAASSYFGIVMQRSITDAFVYTEHCGREVVLGKDIMRCLLKNAYFLYDDYARTTERLRTNFTSTMESVVSDVESITEMPENEQRGELMEVARNGIVDTLVTELAETYGELSDDDSCGSCSDGDLDVGVGGVDAVVDDVDVVDVDVDEGEWCGNTCSCSTCVRVRFAWDNKNRFTARDPMHQQLWNSVLSHIEEHE